MKLHSLIGSAFALILMGSPVHAAPASGIATGLRPGGHVRSVEKADYRRCGWYHGRRYCRWYRDYDVYPYGYYDGYAYDPYYYAPYYGYGPSFRFYYGGGGRFHHGGRRHR